MKTILTIIVGSILAIGSGCSSPQPLDTQPPDPNAWHLTQKTIGCLEQADLEMAIEIANAHDSAAFKRLIREGKAKIFEKGQEIYWLNAYARPISQVRPRGDTSIYWVYNYNCIEKNQDKDQ